MILPCFLTFLPDFHTMSNRQLAAIMFADIAGYTAMLALLARADTFYWALLVAPLAFVGLAFLPKALSDLVKAARRTPYPAT